MADDTTPAHLDPSALGTKEYWDKLYETELRNHADNPADEGTVWFDDADAEAKMVAYLDERDLPASLLGRGGGEGSDGDRADAAVLDLGCGNGSLLFALRDDGWTGRLLGVDYSERSVKLARKIAVARAGDGGEEVGEDGEQRVVEAEGGEGEEEVEFRVWDVLRGEVADVRADPSSSPQNTGPVTETDGAGWDVVLDKGTFDAVSLSAERDAQGRRVCEGYGERVLQLLRTGGLFLVTSCNWTEAELTGWFDGKAYATARLRLAGRIAYPSFSFGGVKGQTISTLCFEKVAA